MTALTYLLMFAGSYYFAAITQTMLHRVFGHHDRIRKVYDRHANGHHRAYPPHQLLGAEWRESAQHVMWYYAIPFVPAAGLVLWLFGWAIFLAHAVGMIFAIWWHIHLHEQYHLTHSVWNRFGWFQRKRALHFVHHRDVHKNYAIVEYWIDILLGTRKEPGNPTPAHRPVAPRSRFACLPTRLQGTQNL